MRQSRWLLSIAPNSDETVYLVADNSGRNGSAWCEADLERAVETVIQDLLAGEYRQPIRVSPSTRPSAGRKMFPRTLPARSSAVAICNSATSPRHLQEFVDRYSPQDLQQFSLRLV